MPIEIQTPNSLCPIRDSYPHWNSNTAQDFVTIESLNHYIKTSQSFKFKLRAERNAFIIFVLYPRPYYHVCFGDDSTNNTSSTFSPKTNKRNALTTPEILSGTEFQGFWIKWTKTSIYVGRENENNPFIKWDDKSIDLNLNNLKIAFCTIGVNGTWIIDDSEFRTNLLCEPSIENHDGCWVPASGGYVPPGAIAGGLDNDEQQFIARGYYHSLLIPGKLHPSHGCCYVPFEGREYACRDYEVLCSLTGEWVWMRNGDPIRSDAIKSICRKSGETFHIGRSYRNGALVIGKVYPSSKLCYIGYDGREVLAVDYELFINSTNMIE